MEYKCARCGKVGPLGGYSVIKNLDFCPDCWKPWIEMQQRHFAEEQTFLASNVAKKETTMEVEPT